MVREEGHYTIKRVDELPKKGNANWLYILKSDPIDKFFRWSYDTGKYEQLNVGGPANYALSDTIGGASTISLTKGGVAVSTIDLSSYNQTVTDFSFNATTNILSLSTEDGDTNIVDLSALKDEFSPNIIVDNYDDLLLVTGQSMFEFAEVLNAQGIFWLPGSLGGTYRAAGLYYWSGAEWIHDNDAILKGLQDLTDLHISKDLANRIVVRQSNIATTLGGAIDPTKEYFIDGVVDTTSMNIEVPEGGINLKGYDFNLSKLISSDSNYTMFTSPVGGSGDILWQDIAFEVTGANSKLLDVVGETGFEAFEIARINFNDCTSLGIIDNYRQGLEVGTGRFGGTPELTLEGTWVGGYFIDTSIVRSLVDGAYSLYKAGATFSMLSRFRSNQNIDLNSTVSFVDFSPSNFVNSSTLQLQGCLVTRNGVSDSSDTTIIPNIASSDLKSDWTDNNGIANTFVGGQNDITIEATTTISATNTFVDLEGTYTTFDLQHFDSPVNGQLRHLGDSPREYLFSSQFVLDAGSNNEVDLRIVIFRDATTSFENSRTIRRVINNLQGGRDVAYFVLNSNIILNKNDYVKLQVANTTNTTDITAEVNSYFQVSARK